MSTHELIPPADVTIETVENNLCVFHSGEDRRLLYVGAQLEYPADPNKFWRVKVEDKDIYSVHAQLMEISKEDVDIPSFMTPIKYANQSHTVILFRCNEQRSLWHLAEHLFEKESVYDRGENEWRQEWMYGSLTMKKLISNMINLFHLHLRTWKKGQFFPVLDLKYLFVGVGGSIIFTRYAKKDCLPGHGEAVKFFNDLRQRLEKVDDDTSDKEKFVVSESLEEEFRELTTWLIQWWPTSSAVIPTTASSHLGCVFFWSRQIRIQYISVLAEDVINGNERAIHGKSSNAFTLKGTKTAKHWGKSDQCIHHPILKPLFDEADSYYRLKNAIGEQPHIFRQDFQEFHDDMTQNSCGLVRFRDAFEHVEQKKKWILYVSTILDFDVSAVVILNCIQDVFPKFMVEIAKAIKFTDFDASVRVVNSLHSSSGSSQ